MKPSPLGYSRSSQQLDPPYPLRLSLQIPPPPMATRVSFDLETKGMDTLIAFTDLKTYQKILKRSLSPVGRAVKTQAGKEVSSRYSLKSSRVKKDIGNIRVSPAKGEAVIPFSTKPPTIRAYGARFSGASSSAGRGRTTWKVFKAGAKRSSTSVFWRSGKNGILLPFISRKDSTGQHKYWKGIRVLYGPSIGKAIFGDKGKHSKEMLNSIADRMSESFDSSLKRALDSIGKGY